MSLQLQTDSVQLAVGVSTPLYSAEELQNNRSMGHRMFSNYAGILSQLKHSCFESTVTTGFTFF